MAATNVADGLLVGPMTTCEQTRDHHLRHADAFSHLALCPSSLAESDDFSDVNDSSQNMPPINIGGIFTGAGGLPSANTVDGARTDVELCCDGMFA